MDKYLLIGYPREPKEKECSTFMELFEAASDEDAKKQAEVLVTINQLA